MALLVNLALVYANAVKPELNLLIIILLLCRSYVVLSAVQSLVRVRILEMDSRQSGSYRLTLVDPDYLAYFVSFVLCTDNLLLGRPYGSTGGPVR